MPDAEGHSLSTDSVIENSTIVGWGVQVDPSQVVLGDNADRYVCPQCGPDPRGADQHAWYRHTIDGLLGKPYTDGQDDEDA